MKLSALNVHNGIIAPTLDQVQEGIDTNKLPLTASINTGVLSQHTPGELHYQFSNDDHFYYNRSVNSLVSPFVSDIDFSIGTITDSDNVSATSTENVSPTGIDIKFGRLRLENSFGPETSDLPQSMKVEYFNGSGFVNSLEDNCTSYDHSKIIATKNTLDPTTIIGGKGNFKGGKTGEISLESPGAGKRGQIDVLYGTHDWLKYDWKNDNGLGLHDDNPTAVATFGLFRGNDRIIYSREVFN
ncbi:MAG: hypothetical protein GY787_26825 [Alteromonadales bacterium]|nr:hypothetical protein [Alteromonadales bacterium]